MEALKWITNQPGWTKHISTELETKVTLALENPQDFVPFEIQKRKRKEALRKVRLLQAWYHDDPSFVDGSRGFPVISIDSLSNEWLADFLKNCQRDNRTNMLEYLQLNMEKNKIVPAQNAAE